MTRAKQWWKKVSQTAVVNEVLIGGEWVSAYDLDLINDAGDPTDLSDPGAASFRFIDTKGTNFTEVIFGPVSSIQALRCTTSLPRPAGLE